MGEIFYFIFPFKAHPRSIVAKDRVYLHNVMHLDFALTYSGDLVADMPHGKGMNLYFQVVRQKNKLFMLMMYIFLPFFFFFFFFSFGLGRWLYTDSTGVLTGQCYEGDFLFGLPCGFGKEEYTAYAEGRSSSFYEGDFVCLIY